MDDWGECFVCMDEQRPAPPSQCRCIGRYVHPQCQQRLLQRSGSCAVCNGRYGNVVEERRPSANAYFFAFFLMCCAVQLTLSLVLLGIVVWMDGPTEYRTFAMAGCVLSVLCALEACFVRAVAMHVAGPGWMVCTHRRVKVRIGPRRRRTLLPMYRA